MKHILADNNAGALNYTISQIFILLIWTCQPELIDEMVHKSDVRFAQHAGRKVWQCIAQQDGIITATIHREAEVLAGSVLAV